MDGQDKAAAGSKVDRTRAARVEAGMRSLRPENLPPDNLLRESLRPDISARTSFAAQSSPAEHR